MPTREEIREAIATRVMILFLAEGAGLQERPEYSLLRWEMRELRKLWRGEEVA